MNYYQENHAAFLEGLKTWLRIPSISTLSEHKPDIRRAAEFALNELRAAGLTGELIEGEGNPLVFAEWTGAPGKPTLLMYGHYDVQPPDPLDEWKSPPFEPEVRGQDIFARGSSDDKGQTYILIKAVEGLLKTRGKLPVNVKFLIEGEEETGGEHIESYVGQQPARIACDAAIICDTEMFAPELPTICIGPRFAGQFEAAPCARSRTEESAVRVKRQESRTNAVPATAEGVQQIEVPLTAGNRRQLKDHAASAGVRASLGGHIGSADVGTIKIAGFVENQISQGRGGAVLATGEGVEHGLLPFSAGGWRQLIDDAAAIGSAGARAEIASDGSSAVEVPRLVENRGGIGISASDAAAEVEDHALPPTAGHGSQFVDHAVVSKAAGRRDAVEISSLVEYRAARRRAGCVLAEGEVVEGRLGLGMGAYCQAKSDARKHEGCGQNAGKFRGVCKTEKRHEMALLRARRVSAGSIRTLDGGGVDTAGPDCVTTGGGL